MYPFNISVCLVYYYDTCVYYYIVGLFLIRYLTDLHSSSTVLQRLTQSTEPRIELNYILLYSLSATHYMYSPHYELTP